MFCEYTETQVAYHPWDLKGLLQNASKSGCQSFRFSEFIWDVTPIPPCQACCCQVDGGIGACAGAGGFIAPA